jgi:DNA-binding XRE family transcriptional regulator
VPAGEIDRALEHRAKFEANPEQHTHEEARAMARKRKPTKDAVEILDRRYYEGRPERQAGLEEARANDTVARQIYELRTRAGLTQRQLAKLVGTTASVICLLEDADYEGHSMAMLTRIAAALNQRVEIRFVPLEAKPAHG